MNYNLYQPASEPSRSSEGATREGDELLLAALETTGARRSVAASNIVYLVNDRPLNPEQYELHRLMEAAADELSVIADDVVRLREEHASRPPARGPLLRLVLGAEQPAPAPETVQQKRDILLGKEARHGATLFGVRPVGQKTIGFYCLDSRTWLWHEQVSDGAGNPMIITSRYEIHGDGQKHVQKLQDQADGGTSRGPAHPEEVHNLLAAARAYAHKVRVEVYRLVA